jgi:ketosteroid isomerase-like protein
MDDSAEANKDVIRRLMADVDRGNLDAVEAYYSAKYVDHTPSPIRPQAAGRAGVRRAFAMLQRAFPDSRHVIEDLVAEGDRVVRESVPGGLIPASCLANLPRERSLL